MLSVWNISPLSGGIIQNNEWYWGNIYIKKNQNKTEMLHVTNSWPTFCTHWTGNFFWQWAEHQINHWCLINTTYHLFFVKTNILWFWSNSLCIILTILMCFCRDRIIYENRVSFPFHLRSCCRPIYGLLLAFPLPPSGIDVIRCDLNIVHTDFCVQWCGM